MANKEERMHPQVEVICKVTSKQGSSLGQEGGENFFTNLIDQKMQYYA